MDNPFKDKRARSRSNQAGPFLLSAFAALAIAACNQTTDTASRPKGPPQEPRAPGDPPAAPEEYGEFLARPEELAPVTVNDIVKSTRLNSTAMRLGKDVFAKNCASCHGEDLKGIPAQHTPDLTDADWRFSGDDLQSGGLTKLPSDVEWTVRYGIRSGHENARGNEADMLAFDPQFRNAHDLGDYGTIKTVNAEEIDDLAEYVLKIGGQRADTAKADRGAVLFLDNAKGNCADCHTDEATGNPALGSTDLTRPKLYLWGSDRASIVESITKGRAGMMPAFEKTLKPEDLKAVSIYTWSRAAKEPPVNTAGP
jgi:cytochrome c oxidase cbb3-type subunit 3